MCLIRTVVRSGPGNEHGTDADGLGGMPGKVKHLFAKRPQIHRGTGIVFESQTSDHCTIAALSIQSARDVREYSS
jgi:hypothetical protein